jgi:tetraacyldisaccharide 4'-kinase
MPESPAQSLARRWWGGQLGGAGAVLDVLLAPGELLYRAAIAGRNRAYQAAVLRRHRADIPVVSVGNLTVGGAGKTPFAQQLARMLRERGARPAILHGGYAQDEPALHRQWSGDIPVIVDRDRVRGARAASRQGADVVVLDDGFQHRRLHRDLDIVLIAVERWDAHDRMLPRGPAREPRSAVRRAHLLVTTRKTAAAEHAAGVREQLRRLTAAPVISVFFEPAEWLWRDVPSEPPRGALVVAGLADPELFVASAQAAGGTVHDVILFPDHHRYSVADAQQIVRRANGAPIVTTQKDWIKLRVLLPDDRVWLLVQHVRVEYGADVLAACLERVLSVRTQRSRTR